MQGDLYVGAVDPGAKPKPIPRPPDAVAVFAWRLNGWRVFGYVSDTPAGLAVSQMRVEPDGKLAPGGLTTAVLRGVPVSRVLQETRVRLLAEEAILAGEDEVDLPRRAGRAEVERAVVAAGRAEGRKGGRPALPQAVYRRTAALYLEELSGGIRGLLDRVAGRLSMEMGRPIPRETARDWVHKAREKYDYLTPTKQGRAGGTGPTRRLVAEWDEAQVPLGPKRRPRQESRKAADRAAGRCPS